MSEHTLQHETLFLWMRIFVLLLPLRLFLCPATLLHAWLPRHVFCLFSPRLRAEFLLRIQSSILAQLLRFLILGRTICAHAAIRLHTRAHRRFSVTCFRVVPTLFRSLLLHVGFHINVCFVFHMTSTTFPYRRTEPNRCRFEFVGNALPLLFSLSIFFIANPMVSIALVLNVSLVLGLFTARFAIHVVVVNFERVWFLRPQFFHLNVVYVICRAVTTEVRIDQDVWCFIAWARIFIALFTTLALIKTLVRVSTLMLHDLRFGKRSLVCPGVASEPSNIGWLAWGFIYEFWLLSLIR